MCKIWKGFQKMVFSFKPKSLLSSNRKGSSILENAAVYEKLVRNGDKILENAYPIEKARKAFGARNNGCDEQNGSS